MAYAGPPASSIHVPGWATSMAALDEPRGLAVGVF